MEHVLRVYLKNSRSNQKPVVIVVVHTIEARENKKHHFAFFSYKQLLILVLKILLERLVASLKNGSSIHRANCALQIAGQL
jgi:hypothetical protein